MRFACYCNIKINSTKTVRIVAKGNLSLAKPNPFAKRKTQGFDTMKIAMKDIFGSIAAGALALTPVAAFSQATPPANQNAVASSFQELTVQYVDATGETIAGARGFAAAASNNKVAIVVWGGNRTIQQEAYNAALDLVDMGIPTAFVLAPDGNGLEGDAHMQIYAASTPRSNAAFGTNYAHEVRSNMREAAIVAYQEAFPQQLAALSIR